MSGSCSRNAAENKESSPGKRELYTKKKDTKLRSIFTA